MASKFTFSAGTTLPEQKESVSSGLALIARYESPLLTLLGFPGSLPTTKATKHQHIQGELLPNSTTINGDQSSVETTINVATDTGERFIVGDMLQVDGSREYMVVTAVAASVVTVTRAQRGTTAVALTDARTIRRMNNPPEESETAPASVVENRERVTNYTEAFRDTLDVSRAATLVDLHAVRDEIDYQSMNKKKALIRNIAYTLYRGLVQSSNPQGAASNPRTMNGIIPIIQAGDDPVNIDCGGEALSQAWLEQLFEEIYTAGGSATLLALPPQQRTRLSRLLQGRTRYKVEDSILGAVVERYIGDFGEIDVMAPDLFIPPDCVLALDMTKIWMYLLGGYPQGGDPFEMIEIGRTGLGTRFEMVTELTLELHSAGEGGHGLLYNLAW